MRTQTITLEQVLGARDRRAEIQNKMLSDAGHMNGICLVCLNLNIAGEVKRTPMTRILFDRGVAEFKSLGFDVIANRVIDGPTGSEAFWLVGGDAAEVKSMLESVEESFPAARLFDFDVLTADEKTQQVVKLSRAVSRSCLVCGGPVAECARSRRHGLDAVKEATQHLLKEFCAEELAKAAYNSLMDELYTTPKPGLVDLANCGAHTDMDVPLFKRSAACLRLYFHDAALMGMNGCSMKELRIRGLTAEQDMFTATGGVNTHKGMIYSMGLLLAGSGNALAAYSTCDTEIDSETERQSEADTDENMSLATFFYRCIQNAADYASEDAKAMLAKSADNPVTNGGKVLRKYGAGGAMQEAATGFPNAVYCADRLLLYEELDDLEDRECADEYRNSSTDDSFTYLRAGALAFCDIMARLEDTNLLHRGGPDGLAFARDEAARISSICDYDERIRELADLDEEMISRNLSPGGSADMLALAFFINRLRVITANV